jgi:hypothetical protein
MAHRRGLALSLCLLAVGGAISLGSATSSALAGDLNQSLCPNEGLVGFTPTLPDCRAHELVTPPFQDGANDFGVTAVAADGSRLIGSSLGTFAGAESNTLGPTYEMTRGARRWEASSISPTAITFPANEFLTSSPDLATSLWALRSSTQSIYAKDLYRRERDGAFVRIGPMVPPGAEVGPPAEDLQALLGAYTYVGASSDLSHVYFVTHHGVGGSAVWPGDTTGSFPTPPGFSLYEYVGVGKSQPQLVGLNSQGQLISDCSTYLGAANSAEVYNAVSADGARIYFTAEGHSAESCPESVNAPSVTEVWARLGGIESVPISEPEESDCEACSTSTRAPAQFQGASEDGTKVFFTTAQELLPEAGSTNLYEFDFAAPRGKRVVRVSTGAPAPEVQGVARVSGDGSHVYFVARARLTDEPRGGASGECLEGEDTTEKAEEEATHEGRCRAKAGKDNLYLFERDAAHPGGRLTFVATLAESDASDWQPTDSRPAQATPTGRYLVFDSAGALTPGVAGEAPQVYEYDAQSEELIRVSHGQSGYPQGTENANASFAVITAQHFTNDFRPTDANSLRAISSDGATVMFLSPAALAPEAVVSAEHSAESVYEYRSSGKISAGDVYLLSGGQNTLAAIPQGLSDSGGAALFIAPNSLVSMDTNTGYDMYDARVDGGFALAEAPSCSGEGCLGPLPTGPGPQPISPGTLSVAPSNATPPPSLPPAPPVTHPKPPSALARALSACRHKRRRAARTRCERAARRHFSHRAKSKRAGRQASAVGRGTR